MQVLIILFGSLFLYRGLGALGVSVFETWISSARFALSTMFLFTAMAHFTPMRKDLIAMVPQGFPRPDLLVMMTGVLEVAGAVGLLLSATRFAAAMGLIALMLAMLPANINAARNQIELRGNATTRLWNRVPMQVLFVAWAWVVR